MTVLDQSNIMNRVKITKAICDALGLDVMKVCSVTLTASSKGVFVDVTYPVFNDRGLALGEALKHFELSERP